jgi:hypothetical protein
LKTVADLYGEGRISLEVGWELPLADAARALETSTRGGGGTAVVLRP